MGIYPALYSSGLKPTILLKGKIRWKGGNGLTQTMTGLQFTLTVVAMVAGIAFVRNIEYQQQIKFGYDYEDVITVSVKNKKQFETMHRAITVNPRVESVSVSHGTLGGGSSFVPVQFEEAEYQARLVAVGQNYFQTMGFEFIDGRAFNFENASDVIEGVVVNRAFAAVAGFDELIDKVIVIGNVKRRVLGVIENHIDNLWSSKTPEPFVFIPLGPDQYSTLLVKAQPGTLAETQSFLEDTWKKSFYGEPFEIRSQSDIIFLYTKRMNVNMGKMLLFISVVGGLLCGSGIFALASLNVNRRRKEIGVRRTLGASISNIVALMNKEFMIILILACIAGSVGGYYTTDSLLSAEFAHRIDVGAFPIILSIICILGIGISTTSMTLFKAAKRNPVDSLRTE